jgi:hypothetical protein
VTFSWWRQEWLICIQKKRNQALQLLDYLVDTNESFLLENASMSTRRLDSIFYLYGVFDGENFRN